VIHGRLLHNDRICDSTEPLLSPGQLGVLAGWGIFTTMRVADGVLFAFDRHWARMKRDAELLHVPFLNEPAALESALLRLVEANEAHNATMRVVVVRNRGGLWEGPDNARQSDLIAMTADLTKWGDSVRLGVVPEGRHAASPFAGTKILSWAQNLTWYEQAHSDGFDEVLLLNERGEIAECTSANVFAVFGAEVYTPPLSSGCLPGVTRNLLLEETGVPGIQVRERVLRLDDLEGADQVFISSTTRGLRPAAHIQGLTIRNQGDTCAKLQQSFENYVSQYVAMRNARRAGVMVR
jgi:branched-chain amino acid aminotransferase